MNKIKFYRKQNRMTIRKLSQKSELAIGYISDLENYKRKNPTKETMEKISAALGKTVIEVFYSNLS